MARHLFFAITLIGTGMLLNSPAEAVTAARCEDQAANCVGRCANPTGGANQNRCMRSCDRLVTRCLIRAHGAAPAVVGGDGIEPPRFPNFGR
jgi:hypothetical protein